MIQSIKIVHLRSNSIYNFEVYLILKQMLSNKINGFVLYQINMKRKCFYIVIALI